VNAKGVLGFCSNSALTQLSCAVLVSAGKYMPRSRAAWAKGNAGTHAIGRSGG
jgi:hypothetical protein